MIKAKIGAILASGALLLSTAMPAFAQGTTNLTVSDNGADTNNVINSDVTKTNTVVQNNTATVTNAVTVTGDTGGNDANKNTGGSVSIQTGDATSRVTLSTKANVNVATTPDCNGCSGTLNGSISGNGADSYNHINASQTTTNSVFQNNLADITNAVTTDLTTGDNRANENTGGTSGKDVAIMTGNAGSEVTVNNRANANLANLGGGTGAGGSSTTNLTISQNGADSNSTINRSNMRTDTITQSNLADISNALTLSGGTGGNRADENTNDSVFVGTGDTAAIATVMNRANFNAATTDCGCLLTDNKTISGNGADSYNQVNQSLADSLMLFQGSGDEHQAGNGAMFSNALTIDPVTGTNHTNENTGTTGANGVAVLTGNSGSLATINNTTGANVFGSLTLPNGTDLGLSFDMGGLFGFLGV